VPDLIAIAVWEEIGTVVLFSLLPAVPVAVLGWLLFRRRRRAASDIAAGRSEETPFAALAVVGLFFTAAAAIFLALTLLARWLA
jgi:NO-binding membrane sensor protein with MHYT domain